MTSEEIIEDVNKVIDATNESLLNLSYSCSSFISIYEDYLLNETYDAPSLLKEKMKEAVIAGTPLEDK